MLAPLTLYKGLGKPPMHGDFEAQRHWMEITTHLPPAKWYFYDLNYWGLDYPPLTAYHSWVLGKMGSMFNPAWFALDASRGMEEPDLKLYMRATVLVSEYLIFIPAAVMLFKKYSSLHGASRWESSVALTAFIMQPGTMLIDHGHFQYNTVMLGLVLGTMAGFFSGRYALGCVLFVGALCFKQMALYYAPAVFAYLLGVCFFPRLDVVRLLRICISTALAFAVMFAPLLIGVWLSHSQDPGLAKSLSPPELFTSLASISPVPMDRESPLYVPVLHIAQAIHRIFPFARGLFEDKVANFWCAVHTAYKLSGFPTQLLTRVSLLATLGSISPACLIIFLKPKRELLPLAFASCAWGFFMFSFQVHEKSVLLPLLPLTTLLVGAGGLSTETRAWVGFANTIGCWTMYPLLKRDELGVPYAVLTLLWAYLLELPPVSWHLYRPDLSTDKQAEVFTSAVHVGFYVLALVWHFCEAFIAPPNRFPDLWLVINACIGAAAFGVCYLWCTGRLVYQSGLIDFAKYAAQEEARVEKARADIAARRQQMPKKK